MSRSLDSLRVLDRLEVGPTRVERRRLVCPYRVFANGEEDVTELRYRWEEDVFEPDDEASQNLASVIAAQVALNYGLFCNHLIFHGSYDRHDQRFLLDAAHNTAREIYVKRFLQPNPFLTQRAAEIEPEKSKSYLQADVAFEGPEPQACPSWPSNSSRVAILSSGGKESLLSFGLLDELGQETHPVFINESGRHWFTALNAHRYFAEAVPNTARVWTNSDRVFAWMLRHLPFVRQDFASVRSDEYPIRLWTVAVFLFGALPLVRKRDIGRIVIGDEFDTTTRTSFNGITHYDGLYDQSRYFDNALSRYYRRKGWGVTQFSPLRQMSELLVEKVLVERYPHIQRFQTSCHATHKENDTVRPCGKCEKCRRVVGMLCALGADPTQCGYTKSQIEACLSSLAGKGVRQESAGARHMMFLLLEKGMLPKGSRVGKSLRPHPEILKLRFDRERSPIEVVPLDLRTGLYRILLDHCHGAVRRSGRVWISTQPLEDPAGSRPFPHETPSPNVSRTGRNQVAPAPRSRSHDLGSLTWPEAKRRLQEVDLALLPVGAVEQHGPHLPLDTDAFDARYLALRVAEKCGDPKPLVLPLIPFGVSFHHDDFPGTISVGNEALSKMVYDVGVSCARNGITKLVIVNGHGGNTPTLQFAAQMINRDAHIFTCVDTGETSNVDLAELCETPNDVHAGEIETSTSLATRPHLVQMKKAERLVPEFSSRYLDFTTKRSVEWYARTARISYNGVLGDPTRASREKGEKMWQVMIENLVELVEDLKNLTLDEIYQRRY